MLSPPTSVLRLAPSTIARLAPLLSFTCIVMRGTTVVWAVREGRWLRDLRLGDGDGQARPGRWPRA